MISKVNASHVQFLSDENFIKAVNFIDRSKEDQEKINFLEKQTLTLDLFRAGISQPNSTFQNTLDLFSNIFISLNEEQKIVFGIITSHLRGDAVCKTADNEEGQLRMFVSGAGGTGKTHLIKCVFTYCQLMFPFDNSKYGPVVKLAPTGVAAHNIDGNTIDSVFPLKIKNWQVQDKNSDTPQKVQFREDFQFVKFVIIDEFSMVGLFKLGLMNRLMNFVKFNNAYGSDEKLSSKNLFGGVHVLFCGDLFQLGPVKDSPVYCNPFTTTHSELKTAVLEEGCSLYESINCFFDLKVQNRQTNSSDLESRFRNSLTAQRENLPNADDDELNGIMTVPGFYYPEVLDAPIDSIFLGATNAICIEVNKRKMQQFIKLGYDPVHLWASVEVQNATPQQIVQVRKNIYQMDCVKMREQLQGLRPYLILCIGARVRITRNRAVSMGLYNGAVGTVVGFLYKEDAAVKSNGKFRIPDCMEMLEAIEMQPAIPIVLVKLDCYQSTNDFRVSCDFLEHFESNVVPISPETVALKRETNNYSLKVFMTQLPLELAWCMSIHRCQGMSLSHGFIIKSKMFCRGLAYVARSRFRTCVGLKLIGSLGHGFNNDDFVTENEMDLFSYETEMIRNEYDCLLEITHDHMDVFSHHSRVFILNDYVDEICRRMECTTVSATVRDQMDLEMTKKCERLHCLNDDKTNSYQFV